MPGPKETVSERARRDFDKLIKDLDRLVLKIPPEATGMRATLCDLMRNFQRSANDYFTLATQLIEENDSPTQQRRKAYNYGRVLKKIADHIGLLAELDRQLASDDTRPPQVQAIIEGIASRFAETPELILASALKFQYIHFNYVEGVGVVAFPEHVLANSALRLPVLWHEVAGFWVARQRKSCRLHRLAEALQKELQRPKNNVNKTALWDWYVAQFKQSRLQRVPVELDVDSDACRVVDSAIIRHYFKVLDPKKSNNLRSTGKVSKNVDSDPTWQLDWMGEFMEDLFGAQALHVHYFRSLTDALLRAYPDPLLGDDRHPTPVLRLQVVLELLNLLARRHDKDSNPFTPTIDELNQTVEEIFQVYPALRECLGFAGITPMPELQETARIVVQFARFPGQEERSIDDWPQLQVAEQEAIRLALRIMREADESGSIQDQASDEEVARKIREDYRTKALQRYQHRNANPEKQRKTTDGANVSLDSLTPCSPPIADPLQRLDAFAFVDTDGDVIGPQTIPPLTI